MADQNHQIVKKIIGYAEKILSYCCELSEDNFLADDKLVEACVFNLIQIGESTRLLDDDFMDMHSNIPWHKIRGLRNRIVHNYEGVDQLLIWDIISEDLADLIQQLSEIIKNTA